MCLSVEAMCSDKQKESIFCLIQSDFALPYWFVPTDERCGFDKTISAQMCKSLHRCAKVKSSLWGAEYSKWQNNLSCWAVGALQEKCLDNFPVWPRNGTPWCVSDALDKVCRWWFSSACPSFSLPHKSFDLMRCNFCAQASTDSLMWSQDPWHRSQEEKWFPRKQVYGLGNEYDLIVSIMRGDSRSCNQPELWTEVTWVCFSSALLDEAVLWG